MQSTDNALGDFNQQAMLKTLSGETREFLKDIATLVSESENEKVPIDDVEWQLKSADNEISDWSLFSDFVTCVTQKGLKKQLKDFFVKNSISNSTAESIRSEGLGYDNAIKVFCLSAHYQNRPLDEFIKDYVLFCESQKFYPKSFLKNKPIVNDMLKEYGKSLLDEEDLVSADGIISPQDTIVLENEIEDIKQLLGFYPRKKDQVVTLNTEELTVAANKVEALLSARPDDDAILTIKTILLLRQGKAKKALELSSKLFSRNDKDRTIRTNHAASLSANDKNKKAIEISLETLNDFNNNPLILSNTGYYFAKLKKYEEAIPYLLKAIRTDRHMIAPYFDCIKSLYMLGQVREARAIAKTGLRKFPDVPQLYLYYRDVLDGNPSAEMYENLLKLYDLDELPINSYRFSDLIEIRKGTLEKQGKFFPEYIEDIEINPICTEQDYTFAYSMYGQYWLNMYRAHNEEISYAENALDYYTKAIDLEPDYHHLHEMKAATLLILGQDEDAKTCIATASSLAQSLNLPHVAEWHSYIFVCNCLVRHQPSLSTKPLLFLLETYQGDTDTFSEHLFFEIRALLMENDTLDREMLDDLIYAMREMELHLRTSYPISLNVVKNYQAFILAALEFFDCNESNDKQVWAELAADMAYTQLITASLEKSKSEYETAIWTYEKLMDYAGSNDVEIDIIVCLFNTAKCYYDLFYHDIDQTEAILNKVIENLLAARNHPDIKNNPYYDAESLYLLATSYSYYGELYDKSFYKKSMPLLIEYESHPDKKENPIRDKGVDEMIELAKSCLEQL